MTQALLFEIGVEEIPSTYFDEAVRSVLTHAPKLLEECGWAFDELQVLTGPRRFVIYTPRVRREAIPEEEKTGPLKDQAYVDGRPTAALSGFVRSVNKQESDVYLKETSRGPRVCVKVRRQSKPLRHFFETLPKEMEFPKLMRWERTRFSFTRPIRWTFAYLGTQLQNYQIADVRSGTFTYGHRFLSPGSVKVKSADLDSFERLLLRHHVVLRLENRVAKIRRFLRGTRNEDQGLVHAVANLVEEPFSIGGIFSKKYLDLPAEVLVTCMRKGQRIFACYDRAGRLMNRFVAILNGRRRNVSLIAKNYERVLRSRLEDARFFFLEDQKNKLERKVELLKDMIFLGSLGSYLDKVRRLERQVEYLGNASELPQGVREHAKRAAHLAKADLTTHLVYEFPELQGIAGAEYARIGGEKKEVARAISGHYLPKNLSEEHTNLRRNLNVAGALVGLADRMDLLIGALGLGIELNASQDPYALRRAGGSIVKILRAHPLRVRLSGWIRNARDQYGNRISKSAEELITQLEPFFKDRIAFELQVKQGTRTYEVLQAVFTSEFSDIGNVYERFEQLSGNLEAESFLRACKVMERTSNILKGAKGAVNDHVDPALFQEQLERELYEVLGREESAISKLIEEKKYHVATKRYGDVFYGPIHDFFDQVLVNDENPSIRSNRQALMKRVNRLYGEKVADLSKVINV